MDRTQGKYKEDGNNYTTKSCKFVETNLDWNEGALEEFLTGACDSRNENSGIIKSKLF
jgi:hypothetical protein